ncbi:hypothetical protein GTQ43_38705 [Nostoc sp. KVJ3]|uniref:hypothetical protein n=1 Tax=Nostoc sp. KVJ3 TaxID=457945 RepID=UPI0022386F1D|nr:hypothetical protein [Nostoc sp. KVJ3]MCW5319298.1 hypothetical protein [Nostoc sp. KVJ3]
MTQLPLLSLLGAFFAGRLSVKSSNCLNTSAFFLTQSEIQLIFSHGLDNDRDHKKALRQVLHWPKMDVFIN